MKLNFKIIILLLISFLCISVFLSVISILLLRNNQQQNITLFKEEFIELSRESFVSNSNLFYYNLDNQLKNNPSSVSTTIGIIQAIDPQANNVFVMNTSNLKFIFGGQNSEITNLINAANIKRYLQENILNQVNDFDKDNYNEFLSDTTNKEIPSQLHIKIYNNLGLIIGYGESFNIVKVRTDFIKRQNDALFNQYLLQSLLFSIASFIIVCVLMIFTLRKVVINPLKIILLALQRIENGEYNFKLDLKRKDEIGEIAIAFNKMSSNIEQSYQALEGKVAERTKELEEAKKKLEFINVDLETKVSERTKELEGLKNNLEQEVALRTGELKKNQEEQEIILDSVPAWIFYKNTDNRFIHVNRSFCEGMGLTREELEGKRMHEIFPKEQADAYWKDDLEVINSGKPKLNIVEPVTTKNGLLWMQTRKVPYRDINGNISGIIGFAIDITTSKLAEEENKKHMEQLEVVNNLMIGRELKMIELKNEIERLKKQALPDTTTS